ncbi:MAG: L,D-transpeptidase family protein [Verrucomicrobia bacterium]|nr:L,D-transpeptidase family protein [Verrucomicrobiota bacterium]
MDWVIRASFFGMLFLSGCAEIENTVYDIRGLPPGKVSVVVDLAEQEARLYAGGRVVLTAPISTGREGYDTRPGRYRIIQKDVDHRSSIYGEYVQGGVVIKADANVKKDPKPRGAEFIGAPMPYFLRIYGGVGLHEGELPGYPASHGCIRMPGSKAKRFFAAVDVGTPVKVIR